MGSAGAKAMAVVRGEAQNAFCAVRPPGHHAGPRGVVSCERDPEGSHGFCLLNNVAIGAAYAMARYGAEEFSYLAGSGLAPALVAAAMVLHLQQRQPRRRLRTGGTDSPALIWS